MCRFFIFPADVTFNDWACMHDKMASLYWPHAVFVHAYCSKWGTIFKHSTSNNRMKKLDLILRTAWQFLQLFMKEGAFYKIKLKPSRRPENMVLKILRRTLGKESKKIIIINFFHVSERHSVFSALRSN